MAMIRRRPRALAALGLVLYLLVGLTTSDLQSVEVDPGTAGACPAVPPEPDRPEAGGSPAFTVLQGNLWMLPARPLLLPYAFSADRGERLERFLATVHACRPEVVLLQEVFETSLVELLARQLPGYRVVSSGATDVTGTLNASGLVTLTRLPVRSRRFHGFGPLPSGAKPIEMLAQKGLLAVEVVSPRFDGVLLNLHLYASRDPTEAEVTRAQLREVVAYVRREAGDRPVLVGGDFNLPQEELARLLPPGWTVSSHGPTYDPARNPYTVRGSNNTPGNHRDRREGRGARAIDFLLTPEGTAARVRSTVLDTLLLSDHQFLHHTVYPTDG